MATAWFTWTFGSSNDGTAGWTQLTPYGIFGTGLFTHLGTAWVSVAGSGTRAVQYYSGTQLTPTGSQMLVVGHTTNSSSLTTIAFSYVGQNAGGTRLYAAHGYRYSGTGTSYLGFYTDYDGAIGTAAEATAAQHWNNFTRGYTTGTGSLVTAYDGAGTWTVTWTAPRGGSTGSHTCAFGGGTGWAPTGTAFTPTIAYHSSDNNNRVVFHSYRAEGSADEPQSILYYVGTWAGGTVGTRQWGRDVLGAPSAVCDRAYYPGEYRGWASTVTVTLDDSQGSWGSFIGVGSAGTSSVFAGTWTLQQWFAGLGTGGATGSWVRLFTGVLSPENVTYDYAGRTVQLRLDSLIARLAEARACQNGSTLDAGGGRSVEQVCQITGPLSVVSADHDTGTVRIASPIWQIETGCWLWGSTGYNQDGTDTQERVRVGTSLTVPPNNGDDSAWDGTGTVVIQGDMPTWIAQEDVSLYVTLPWPCWHDRVRWGNRADYYTRVLAHNIGIGTGDATDWVVYAKQAVSYPVAPNDRLFGGERLVDALNGIMGATLGFYSVTALGEFRVRCITPRNPANVDGTISLIAAVAVGGGDAWQVTTEPALASVDVECNWNNDINGNGTYLDHARAGLLEGTVYGARTEDLQLRWLGGGLEGESFAARYWRMQYLPRARMSLRLAGSAWASVLPGNLYAVHDLPAHLTAALMPGGTTMLCYARTYDYESDTTEFELISNPAGRWAYWDDNPPDTWFASGKEWY